MITLRYQYRTLPETMLKYRLIDKHDEKHNETKRYVNTIKSRFKESAMDTNKESKPLIVVVVGNGTNTYKRIT